MGGVDIMDQKTPADGLNCKVRHRFYLGMFLDLTGTTHVNSHIVYMELGDNIYN